ncbi:MAG: DNA alkylation repair protein [Paludibacteraceae bacterium]|nr:DNA alkylation repair protein [Paludibacteraceae bacterium]
METMFRYDEAVENQVNRVKKMLHLSMNGVVSENMSSLDYQLNYGVLLPRIKELAAELERSFPLAQRLWFSNCREMMIMATVLCPIESMNLKEALKWVERCHNMELVEQLCLNLFRKVDGASEWVSIFLSSSAPFAKATGYVLASFMMRNETIAQSAIDACVEKLREDIVSDEYVVYSSVARFLRLYAERNSEWVAAYVDGLDTTKGVGVAWVQDNVRTVLNY